MSLYERTTPPSATHPSLPPSPPRYAHRTRVSPPPQRAPSLHAAATFTGRRVKLPESRGISQTRTGYVTRTTLARWYATKYHYFTRAAVYDFRFYPFVDTLVHLPNRFLLAFSAAASAGTFRAHRRHPIPVRVSRRRFIIISCVAAILHVRPSHSRPSIHPHP